VQSTSVSVRATHLPPRNFCTAALILPASKVILAFALVDAVLLACPGGRVEVDPFLLLARGPVQLAVDNVCFQPCQPQAEPLEVLTRPVRRTAVPGHGTVRVDCNATGVGREGRRAARRTRLSAVSLELLARNPSP